MSKPKGAPKTGGRKAGTPNKVTCTLKEFIKALIDNNREQIEKDLESLQPKDRLAIFEKLFQYIIPKQPDEQKEIPKSVKIEIVGNNNIPFANSEDEIDKDLPERFR